MLIFVESWLKYNCILNGERYSLEGAISYGSMVLMDSQKHFPVQIRFCGYPKLEEMHLG